MKTNIELQKEILKEYEYSKPVVFLIGCGAVVLFLFGLFCIMAGVTALFMLIFPNIK